MKSLRSKLLIFGGSGQIGSRTKLLLSKKFTVIAPTRQEVDITKRDEVENFIIACNPNLILYSVGFTSIDKGLEQPKDAYMLNAGALFYVSNAARRTGVPIYYLSTETVFNGKKAAAPYNEEDNPDPLSFVAQTKRAGEFIVLNSDSRNAIIRLIMCYSPTFERKMDMARMAILKLKKNEVFYATNDQKINPIYVDHLARALEKILANKFSGIIHIGATDYTTPFEFCRKLAKIFNLDENLILPTTFAKFSKTRPEPRPKNQWLDVSKFLTIFGSDSLYTIDEGLTLLKKNLSETIRP